MKKTDEKLVRALVTLNLSPEVQAFTNWLRESLQERRKANDTLSGDELRWGQGGCQVLQAQLDRIDGAVDARDRYERNATRRQNQ